MTVIREIKQSKRRKRRYLAKLIAGVCGGATLVFSCLIAAQFALGSSEVVANGEQQMTNSIEDIVIRNKDGRTVAKIQVSEDVLEGKCEWYNSSGGLVAYGFFKNGKPFAGSFLNWARFFPPQDNARKYDVKHYLNDWMTPYEAAFDSEPPRYVEVIEVYSNGSKIQNSYD